MQKIANAEKCSEIRRGRIRTEDVSGQSTIVIYYYIVVMSRKIESLYLPIRLTTSAKLINGLQSVR